MNWPIFFAHLGATVAVVNAIILWNGGSALVDSGDITTRNLAIPVAISVLLGLFGVYAGIAYRRAPNTGSWQLLVAGLLGLILMWIPPFLLATGILYLIGGVLARREVGRLVAAEAGEASD